MAEIRYPNYKTGQEESIDFIVLNLGYVQLLRDWGNKDISSPFARIYYVRRGNAMLHLPQGDIQVKPGCMYMVPNYVPHSYECQRGFGFYYLFVFQRIRRQADIFDRYEFPIEVPSSEATRQLFSSYCHLYPQLHLPVHDATAFDSHPAFREYAHAFSRMEFYERMQLHGLVAIVFSYFMKGARPRVISTDMRIARLVDYVQQHISPEATFTYYDTICRQVANRMPNIRGFAHRHDAVLFVCGKKSSNGRVLFNACLSVNPRSYFVEGPQDIAPHMLSGITTLGICGATSTPKWLMEQCREEVRSRCHSDS